MWMNRVGVRGVRLLLLFASNQADVLWDAQLSRKPQSAGFSWCSSQPARLSSLLPTRLTPKVALIGMGSDSYPMCL